MTLDAFETASHFVLDFSQLLRKNGQECSVSWELILVTPKFSYKSKSVCKWKKAARTNNFTVHSTFVAV